MARPCFSFELSPSLPGRDKHTGRTGSQSRHKRPLAKPPFETLLNPAGGATEVLEEEEEEEEAVDPSSLVIPRGRDLPRPVDVEGRTPLPLFEEKGNNQRRTKRT